MAIKAGFTIDELRAQFGHFLDVVEEKQIQRLQKVGEQCVEKARNVPLPTGFEDQTGNLRSSIGYGIYKDGVAVVQSTFEQVTAKKPNEGDVYDGAERGKAYCNSIGERTTGITLVCVAGMHYAVYVESKGRDVLTSAEQFAEERLPIELEKLIENIKRAAE